MLSNLGALLAVATPMCIMSDLCMFHIGSDVVRKVWRFMRSDVDDYTRTNVERTVVELYPDLKAKGLRLKMWYHDSLAGKVWIEP